MLSYMSKIFILSLFVLTAAVPAFAVDLNAIVTAVENPFATGAISDFSGKFFQQSQISSLNKVQRGEGKVTVKFDNSSPETQVKFRWQYFRPVEQEVVSDGKTMWVYVPENNQVIESNLESATEFSRENPMAFLTGLDNLKKDFIVVWADNPQDIDGNYILHLRPRGFSRLIESLWLVVDWRIVGGESGFPLKATIVEDPGGNRTTIEFNNIKINTRPFDMEFDFIAPAGVETVYPEDMQF